jgi:erythromycin esterase
MYSPSVVDEARAAARPLASESDLDPLLDRVVGARLVLVGEASHGTHEYYHWRAALTRRLIAECGYSFVAIEADQPDCQRIDDCVRAAGGDGDDPGAALDGLRHWPSWMWANAETVSFSRWLRTHNAGQPEDGRVAWYGLDAYPLWGATRVVLDYLRERSPGRVNASLDGNTRGQPMVPVEHIDAVVARLTATYGGEAHYPSMVRGGTEAWNARDRHWADRLDRLLAAHGRQARGVVWAHNTHIGDARATSMPAAGMVNIGQLARQRYGAGNVALVGLVGGDGEVVAAHERGGAMDTIPVPEPQPGSVEALLAATGLRAALFIFDERADQAWATGERGQRAIGVVYDPAADTDRYVPTRLAQRYDALCWFARTSAVRALHLDAARRGELETLRDPR